MIQEASGYLAYGSMDIIPQLKVLTNAVRAARTSGAGSEGWSSILFIQPPTRAPASTGCSNRSAKPPFSHTDACTCA